MAFELGLVAKVLKVRIVRLDDGDLRAFGIAFGVDRAPAGPLDEMYCNVSDVDMCPRVPRPSLEAIRGGRKVERRGTRGRG